MQNAIEVQGLRKSFQGQSAVLDVSLQVRTGEIFGFLGPNGSGKTTTIRMLCGLLVPDAGQGQCLGYNILTQTAAIKQHVGYMTQRFCLYEDLSIRENLDFVASVYNMDKRQQRVAECIEQLGLGKRQHQLARALSGGWKQQLALAAALLHKPKLLLLDEPTAGVDPKARRDFWTQIHHLAASGITVLVSTHYMDEAERCHRLAYLSFGKLLLQGTPQEIIQSSSITTWQVIGDNLPMLAEKLKSCVGIDQVVAFGNLLHVSGKNKQALENAITAYKTSNTQWTLINPTLEDIFVYQMQENQDARFN